MSKLVQKSCASCGRPIVALAFEEKPVCYRCDEIVDKPSFFRRLLIALKLLLGREN